MTDPQELREAVAKLAEIVEALVQKAPIFGDLDLMVKYSDEAARIAQSLREQTQEERDA